MKPERVQEEQEFGQTESMKPERVQLQALPAWHFVASEKRLERKFLFPTLRAANLFISLVMELGEGVDFVPEIAVNYLEITLAIRCKEPEPSAMDISLARLFSLME